MSVTFTKQGFKIRSEKGNRRPSKRHVRNRELSLSKDEINEALEYLGGSHILRNYQGEIPGHY